MSAMPVGLPEAVPGFAGGPACLAALCKVRQVRLEEGLCWLTFARPPIRGAGGGQPADRGWIEPPGRGRLPILQVRKQSDLIDIAVAAEGPLEVGEEVLLIVDPVVRMAFSRAHTLTHVLMACLAQEVAGFASRGAEIAEDAAYLKLVFDGREPGPGQVERALARAKRIIAEDRTVTTLKAKSLAQVEQNPLFRMDPGLALKGKVRLIEIDGLDLNPCSGSHVERLALIGTGFAPAGLAREEGRHVLKVRLIEWLEGDDDRMPNM